ncbi:MAG: class I tRNA ligase family protein [Actinomycetota bacterium]|nr:class I tRNA ligase family protein [Actinomycetota bacterium]
MLGEDKIEGTRNFANKLWNASKFVISNIDESVIDADFDQLNLNLWDKWILTRLNKTIKGINRYLSRYNFSYASRILYNFFWSDYCDWYIEASKVRIYYSEDSSDKKTALYLLWYVLEQYLRLLHPFMPHVSENIWQNIPHEGESLMVKDYPYPDKNIYPEAEEEAEEIFGVISQIRKVRSELKINPAAKIKVNLSGGHRQAF